MPAGVMLAAFFLVLLSTSPVLTAQQHLKQQLFAAAENTLFFNGVNILLR